VPKLRSCAYYVQEGLLHFEKSMGWRGEITLKIRAMTIWEGSHRLIPRSGRPFALRVMRESIDSSQRNHIRPFRLLCGLHGVTPCLRFPMNVALFYQSIGKRERERQKWPSFTLESHSR
jgi:hypothetical protein